MMSRKKMIHLGMVFSVVTGIASVMASTAPSEAEADSKGAPRSRAEVEFKGAPRAEAEADAEVKIENLPPEILSEIFDHLPVSDMASVSQTSTFFYTMLCQLLAQEKYKDYKNSKNILDRTCKKPVDTIDLTSGHIQQAARKVLNFHSEAHPQTKVKALYIVALASGNRADFNSFTEAYNNLDESSRTALRSLSVKLASTFR